MTRAATCPDSWSKMKISVAKALFAYKTIIELMTTLATKLKCTNAFIHDISHTDNCDIYLHCLEICKEANQKHGNSSTLTMLATIEYCVHVSILFIENLMNGELSLSTANSDEHERMVCTSMNYFQDWKIEADNSQNSKAFLSMITYSDLWICVSGFFAYAHLALHSGVMFVPMLYSNTSILEAFFSLAWSMRKESAQDYPKALSTIHTGSESVALFGNQCKS